VPIKTVLKEVDNVKVVCLWIQSGLVITNVGVAVEIYT
jgi:hypothetical protein